VPQPDPAPGPPSTRFQTQPVFRHPQRAPQCPASGSKL